MNKYPRHIQPPIALFLVACLASLAQADVLVVHPTDALADAHQVQAAVDMAQEGDIILVAPGSYSRVTIENKGLTLQSDPPGVVTLFGSLPVDGLTPPGLTVTNLGASQQLILRGIRIAGGQPYSLFVQDCIGTIWLEECIVAGANGFDCLPCDPPVERNGATAAGLFGATVNLFESTLAGGQGANQVWPGTMPGIGGAAVHADDALLTLANCVVQGGAGGNGECAGADGGPGIDAVGSELHLHDGNIVGGDGGRGGSFACLAGMGGPGGPGASLASSTASVGGSTVSGGLGGEAVHLGTYAPDGEPFELSGSSAVTTLPAERRSIRAGSPVREGQVLTLTITGQPGDRPHLWMGLTSGSWSFASYQGVFHLSVPFLMAGLPLLPIGASGLLQIGLVVPDLGPGFEGGVVLVQIHVASPSDGTVLGSASASVLVDAAL